MTFANHLGTFVLICIAAAVLAGCAPSSANIKLRKENQQLQDRIAALETRRSGDLASIKAMESQSAIPPLVPQSKLEGLFTAHGLTFGRLTGGYREPATAASETGVVVHVVPTDEQGQTLKAAGRFYVTVFDLGVPEKPLVGQRKFSLAEARESWNGRALLFNYVLKVPFQIAPKHDELLIRVEFIDELTGRTITAEKNIKIRL